MIGIRHLDRGGAFRSAGAALAAAVCLASTAAAPAGPAKPDPAPAPPVTDARVRAAVTKAIAFLYAGQADDGRFGNPHSKEYPGGGEALAALALLRAGQDPRDERLQRTLRYLDSVQPEQTYTRSLRAMVYSLLTGDARRRKLAEDVAWLLKHQQPSGGWGYGPESAMTRIAPRWTDASNTQFALLALREASDAGVPVAGQAWREALLFWRGFQNDDGGWGYQPGGGRRPPQRPGSHGSMTAAGVASYFVLADKTPSRGGGANGLRFAEPIDKGLRWLSSHYEVRRVPKYIWMPQPSQLTYYLFCLARVGDAAGAGKIGGHDYAADIAGALCARQRADGSWSGSIVDTSLALLGLQKVGAPVVIAQRRTGDRRPHRPRAAAHVARWLARALRTPAAWRDLGADEKLNPLRCPLLYLDLGADADGAKALTEDLAKFVGAGGTCLIQADGPADAGKLADRWGELLPDHRRRDLPADHPVYTLRFALEAAKRPAMIGVGDRSRTKVLILADDAAAAWNAGRFTDAADLFRLAGNCVLYAGQGRLPAGRLAPARPPGKPPPIRRSIRVARLKHAGGWDAHPGALKRLARTLAHSLSGELAEAPPTDAGERIDPSITVIWMTGDGPPKLTDRQKANLRRYLQDGGTLLIAPAGDDAAFRKAATGLLADLLGAERVGTSRPDSPLITGRFAGGIGADLTGRDAPSLRGGAVGGRIAAVLGSDALAADAAAPGARGRRARGLALNVILYAATHGQVPPVVSPRP